MDLRQPSGNVKWEFGYASWAAQGTYLLKE
jgi:hypothetical protein